MIKSKRLYVFYQNADASVIKRRAFPVMDWRFNEFPNEGAHCLYVTCVELMTLPFEPDFVGLNVMSVILDR